MMTFPARIDTVGVGGRCEAALVTGLRALGADVAEAADLESFVRDARPARAVILDGAALMASDVLAEAMRVRAGSGLSVVCLTGSDDETIEALQKLPYVTSIMARKEAYAPNELRPLMRAWLGRESIGGSLNGHLELGAINQAIRLESYAEREVAFEALRSFAAGLSTFPEFSDTLVGVAWEMLMNALLDAPTAAEALGMTVGGARAGVELAFGSDGESVVIAVTDDYGALERTKIAEALVRSHKRGADQVRVGTSGAGIGLYMLFTNAMHLSFTVRPHVRTRVVVTMRVAKRYRDFTEQARSIHFIEERGMR